MGLTISGFSYLVCISCACGFWCLPLVSACLGRSLLTCHFAVSMLVCTDFGVSGCCGCLGLV